MIVNNLIYNPSQTPLSSILFSDPLHEGATLSVVQGNVLIAGPTTPGHNGYVPYEAPEVGEVTLVRVDGSLHPASRIYLDGNYYDKHCGGSACLASPAAQWMLAKDSGGLQRSRYGTAACARQSTAVVRAPVFTSGVACDGQCWCASSGSGSR